MKRVIQLLLIAALAMLISCARAADTDDESSSDSSSRSVDIEIVSLASYIDSDTSDYTINLVIKNNGSDTAKNFTSSVKAIKDNALTGTAEVELFLTSADLEKDKNVVIKAVECSYKGCISF
ncbi:MAG: hypothetical protein GY730_02060 [bacterium]|nr:hypothetical protein [bacterium]